MHYYQFNIGDYRKDTSHLTAMEHYIYRTLIDWYFLDEKPIINVNPMVLRRLCLGSEWDRSLQNVLEDFFILKGDCWHHKRIDLDIKNFYHKVEVNRHNGKQGGRPRKTQSVKLANQNESENNPNQEPITNNHKPIKYIPPINGELLSDWLEVRNKKKSGKVTKTVWGGIEREAAKAGLSAEQAVKIC